MSTNLETMVKYLAGRGDGSSERLRRELQDASSEASLFLDALRERSRSMFDAGMPPGLDARTVPRRRHGSNPGRVALVAVPVAAMLLVAIGVGWWDRVQLRRLEALQAERDEHWKERIGRLELALGPKPKAPVEIASPPIRPPLTASAPIPRDKTSEMLLARLEDGLARLDERLKEPDVPKDVTKTETEPPTDDQVRRDLESLKRDMNDREKALREDLWEMRTALQGVIFMIRQMGAQSSVGPSMPLPFPTPFPGPMLGPATGQVSGPLTGQPSVNGLNPSFTNTPQHHPEAVHPGQHPDHRGHR